MLTGRSLAAVALMVAVAHGCGGDAFESADGGGSGKTSVGTAGKSTGSGGKSSTQPGAGGDGDEPGSAGEDQGAGGDAGGSGGSGSGGKATLGGQGGVTLGGAMSGGGMNGGTGGGSSGGVMNVPDGPLLLIDLLGIDTSSLAGFNAAGFRCKSLTVCGVAQTCVYHTGFLGSIQSQDTPYSDGDELNQPQAVKVRIAGGAKSDCTGAEFTTSTGDLLKLTYNSAAGQQALVVWLPNFSGTELVLYVRADGSTFYDAALMQLAASPP